MDKKLKNKDISVHFYSTNQVDLSTATAVFTFENDSTKKYYMLLSFYTFFTVYKVDFLN